jgi:hypothetical protein
MLSKSNTISDSPLGFTVAVVEFGLDESLYVYLVFTSEATQTVTLLVLV